MLESAASRRSPRPIATIKRKTLASVGDASNPDICREIAHRTKITVVALPPLRGNILVDVAVVGEVVDAEGAVGVVVGAIGAVGEAAEEVEAVAVEDTVEDGRFLCWRVM